ncbi:P-loop containing nucleoside triphosphate hydrolase protein [Pyronema domesticum]|uniref:Replication factor C subunit 2 n=1 Tax=Pyronema omphalodes (strain CBS 100304) TaxID=1076935 RepID=U4LFX5_PYROM|nr:P-loop containing nucleoside triphosphate hydrolase protein [Pyronema domesticum]CCX30788.1 Similar to Replication factor C subunit 2; acc. no. P0C7N7 [Pyronema omphalodes CBS 100304]
MSFFDLKARRAAAATAAKDAVPSTSAKDTTRTVPWVEKYRPKSLSDVTAQDHTITVLKRTLQSSNLPHMLFYGPPGTGKTSTVLALAKELYGPDLMKSRVLELNASDERGISIVRDKIKNFARTSVSNATTSQSSAYPCPPYKIIILDEADSMTQDAQSALRRTMETYSKITRFCLICNYVTRIIDPLASRCSKFRFKPLDAGSAEERLREICEKEGVRCEDGVIEELIKVAEGDLRRAITYLQSAAKLHNPNGITIEGDQQEDEGDRMDVDDAGQGSEVVTVRSIQEIAGVVPDDVVEQLLKACEPKKGRSVYTEVAKIVEDMVADGWNAGQILVQLYNILVYDDVVTADQKNEIVLLFSEVDKRLADGSDEHLQILDLALRISAVLAK